MLTDTVLPNSAAVTVSTVPPPPLAMARSRSSTRSPLLNVLAAHCWQGAVPSTDLNDPGGQFLHVPPSGASPGGHELSLWVSSALRPRSSAAKCDTDRDLWGHSSRAIGRVCARPCRLLNRPCGQRRAPAVAASGNMLILVKRHLRPALRQIRTLRNGGCTGGVFLF